MNHKMDHMLTIVLIFGTWFVLTLFFPPMVVPSIDSVARQVFHIMTTASLWTTMALTLGRLAAGLAVGILLGSVLGLLFGFWPRVESVLGPVLRIFQTVPPVCWVVLALVWFGFNGKPCIFIVVTATLPTVAINLCQGVRNIDPKLLEMARMYHFSKQKILMHVILPSLAPYIRSSLEIVVGGGWKIVVMGEVLTTSTGIGGAITTARLNIEPETLIAWSVILVSFCYLTHWILKCLFTGKGACTYEGF